jgi:hypothetical protein
MITLSVITLSGFYSNKYFFINPGLNVALTRHKYDLVILMAGTNDLGHGYDSQVIVVVDVVIAVAVVFDVVVLIDVVAVVSIVFYVVIKENLE